MKNKRIYKLKLWYAYRILYLAKVMNKVSQKILTFSGKIHKVLIDHVKMVNDSI